VRTVEPRRCVWRSSMQKVKRISTKRQERFRTCLARAQHIQICINSFAADTHPTD
jgi:hypothetical protein